MATVIPSDWFMGDENPMSKLAWFLYDNAEKVDDEFMSELVEHLKEFDEEKVFTLDDHKPRVAAPAIEEKEYVRLHAIATERVLEKLQAKEIARRKKAKKETPPLLALADGLDINEDGELPTSVYDFGIDHTQVTQMLNVELNIVRAEERQEAERKKALAEAKKKTKKKRADATKKPAKKKVSVAEMKKKKAIS